MLYYTYVDFYSLSAPIFLGLLVEVHQVRDKKYPYSIMRPAVHFNCVQYIGSETTKMLNRLLDKYDGFVQVINCSPY